MTENESLRSIAERLGLTLRVSADGSDIVIRRDGKELLRTNNRLGQRLHVGGSSRLTDRRAEPAASVVTSPGSTATCGRVVPTDRPPRNRLPAW